MGKYKRYKNNLEMFLSSERGKRALNFVYGWGASIVILGALFKLLHLPYANQILFVAMITESIVFFISAFERPGNDYHWEDVFPVLKSKNPMDRPNFSETPVATVYTSEQAAAAAASGMFVETDETAAEGEGHQPGEAASLNVKPTDAELLTESIKKLSEAAEQITKMAELTEAAQQYLTRLSAVSTNADGIAQHSAGYMQQMEQLNRNLSGMNAFYEAQLQRLTPQADSIEHINIGLNRIREMYESSVVDSSIFRTEAEKMTRQIAELNQVYARLLQAMTVNMGYQPQPTAYQQPYAPQPQQPVYQQQPYAYPQQPVK